MKCAMSFSGSALVMGLVAGGCAMDADGSMGSDEVDLPASAPDEQELAGKTAKLAPTFTESWLSQHGGTGGNYTGHVTPPAIIYAVNVSSGDVVDSIRFAWYQPRRADNLYQTGDEAGSTPAYGGSGGVNRGWWYCPGNKGVIGIRGSAGALVDRIGVICGDVTNPDPFSPNNTYSPLWGGSGGSWFGDDKCGAGRVVDSFNVRSGALLDNIRAICISAH